MNALRISPKYKSSDWQALDEMTAAHWPKAVTIVRDRLPGRFLDFADKCLKDKFSGFVVLSIDCLLVETIQQFIDGVIDGHGKSGPLSKKFLKGPRFQPDFATEETRREFYSDIRCGLLHQAEAKNKWLIHRKQSTLLKKAGTDGYIIDVERFHAAVKDSLEDYLADLCKPENADLRKKLWTKMSNICDVRNARGAMYASQSTPGQAP